jgi:hypothetical protein
MFEQRQLWEIERNNVVNENRNQRKGQDDVQENRHYRKRSIEIILEIK